MPGPEAKDKLFEAMPDAEVDRPAKITATSPRQPTLVDHLLSGPGWDDDLDEIITARDRPAGRAEVTSERMEG